MAYNTGSPGGKSGSPGDGGATCVQCHTGTANQVNDWITTNIPLTGYVPGNTYTITLTGTHTGVVKFGFEVSAENSSNAKVGTFILNDPVQTKFTNGNAAVTHTNNGNTPSGNSKTWTVDWTAPSAGTGDVGIYAAFNAANGNGGTSGDVIYKTSLFVSEAANPELVSINPDEGDQGANISASISGLGTSWSGTPMVNLSFSGNPAEMITATGITVTNPTTIQASFSIPTDASSGLWDVNVDALSLEDGFTVNEVIMSLTSIMPDSATQGDMLTATILASNTSFVGTVPDVFISNSINPSETIAAGSVNVLSNTELQADFSIPLDASVGVWDLHVDMMMLEDGFEVHLLTGLKELSFEGLEVYPNPTEGMLMLNIRENADVKLLDMSGNEIENFRVTAGSNQLNLTGRPAGIYFLQIIAEGKMERRKIVVK